ncbi:MAG: GNAT family N-acetyltransferase [Bdellovibrionales bacterium]|nr:GNAT family N-acetyltransferase [Bdellovibrionales bacterium]
MEHIISWARSVPQIEKIELNVRSTNRRAIKLYESKGFIKEGLLEKRIKTPSGDYIDELLMGLLLK